jgi:hypothetical protein
MEPEARRAFLDAACYDEPELKHLIEQLLMEDERAGSFLKSHLSIFLQRPESSPPILCP